jgi:hypothetical protein
VSERAAAHAQRTTRNPARAPVLRRCTCGGVPGPTGECEACRRKRLQHTVPTSQPGDREEREADELAARALRSSGSARVPGGGASPGSRGAPLPPHLRAFFEPRFGHDFSHVRVHTGDSADASARAVGARAYALGDDLVFAAGEFAPATRTGTQLLAHELAHVVQERTAGGSMRVRRACPAGPTGLGATAPGEVCERRDAAVVGGSRFDFCRDSAELINGQEPFLKKTIAEAKTATRVELHGYASVEGPSTEYNYNLSCHRAVAMAARFRAEGVPGVHVFMHGPISLYPVAERNRSVMVVIERPAAPKAPPAPSPADQAAAMADADCTAMTKLYDAHKLDSYGLFLQIYRCLTCSFPAAIRGGKFKDPLWLVRVNRLALDRLTAAFASPNADYKKAFAPCNLYNDCTSPNPGYGVLLACQTVMSSGTGVLSLIQTCTEGIGSVHLKVDLRDALKSAGCSGPDNKGDYAQVVPLFQSCNRAVLKGEIPVVGGAIADVIAIPRITDQRNQAWTDAGCP